MALVVDTVSILEHADLLLYVIKANFAHKLSLGIPIKLQKDKKVKKIALILNGSSPNKRGYGIGGYGYGYGYGVENEKKRWFSFLKR